MAFARDVYTAGAAQTDFTISFSYLAEADINASVDGVVADNDADADTSSFQIVSGTTLRFGAGMTGGEVIVIWRTTSQSARLVDYASGSTLTEEDLDDDSLQAFYMAQEAIDEASTALGLGTDDNWDATNKLIRNLGTPTAATDAVTKAYVDAIGITTGNVPTPNNPADDNFCLIASAGSFAWTQFVANTHMTVTSEARGDLIARGASAWARLAVGAANTVLKSDGTDPAWAKINGTNIALGSDAQGDIMYHNGTDYARLAAGTSGQFLQTLGAGANPQWASINNVWQELATAISVGTSTTVTLTSALAAQDPYAVMVILSDVSTGTDNSTLDLRLGPTSGLLTTGYDSVGFGGGAAQSRTSTTGIALTGSSATWDAVDDLDGYIILEKVGSGNLWMVTGSWFNEPGGTQAKNSLLVTPFDVTGTLDEIGLVCSNNMNAGTCDIYFKA